MKPHVTHTDPPTPLFLRYVLRLVLRLALFAVGVWMYVTDPEQLDITTHFGVDAGLSFVNLVFLLVALDLISKLRPGAHIAMGSRKQYGSNHVPTPRLFEGGIAELRAEALRLVEQLRTDASGMLVRAREEAQQAALETVRGMFEAGRQLAYTIDVLRVLPWPEEDLTANERLRERIRADRMREIIPVIIFWVLFNLAVGLALDRFGLYDPQMAPLWMLFYFLFDMICVVLWCPLQVALMRNRCCTTCQIFNWDGLMTVTPLLPIFCWFSELLILGALVVIVRWELAFVRHPERFDERTNASLQCANCRDKLCYLRKPLTPRRREA